METFGLNDLERNAWGGAEQSVDAINRFLLPDDTDRIGRVMVLAQPPTTDIDGQEAPYRLPNVSHYPPTASSTVAIQGQQSPAQSLISSVPSLTTASSVSQYGASVNGNRSIYRHNIGDGALLEATQVNEGGDGCFDCPLSPYLRCRFSTNDSEYWRTHSSVHFLAHNQEPSRSVTCPMCDVWSSHQLSGWDAWNEKLDHMWEKHIRLGQRLQYNGWTHREVDLISDLFNKRMINNADFRSLIATENSQLDARPVSTTTYSRRDEERNRRRTERNLDARC